MVEKGVFDPELVKAYPRSNKKITVNVRPYNLVTDDGFGISDDKGHTLHISPYGMEFQGLKDYPDGTLLKINVILPDYWKRKQRFVDYSRIDTPEEFKILAKVVHTEEIGKRGKKKLVLVQTVNIDSIDEEVLKSYLQESK